MQSKQSIKLCYEIIDYTCIHFSEDVNLESVFSLEDKPAEETLYSLDVYEEYGNDHYKI